VATVLLRHGREISMETHTLVSVGISGSVAAYVLYNEDEGDVHLNIYIQPNIYAYSVQLAHLREDGQLYSLFDREMAVRASTFILGLFINEHALAGNGFSQAMADGMDFTKPDDLAASVTGALQAAGVALAQSQEEIEEEADSFTDFLEGLLGDDDDAE